MCWGSGGQNPPKGSGWHQPPGGVIFGTLHQCVACYVTAKPHYVKMAYMCVCKCVCMFVCMCYDMAKPHQFVVCGSVYVCVCVCVCVCVL